MGKPEADCVMIYVRPQRWCFLSVGAVNRFCGRLDVVEIFLKIGRHVTLLNQCLFPRVCLSLFLILEGTRKTSNEYMPTRSDSLVL